MSPSRTPRRSARRLGLSVASAAVSWVDVPGSKIRWHTPLSILLDVVRVALLYGCGVWRLQRGAAGAPAAASGAQTAGTWMDGGHYVEVEPGGARAEGA